MDIIAPKPIRKNIHLVFLIINFSAGDVLLAYMSRVYSGHIPTTNEMPIQFLPLQHMPLLKVPRLASYEHGQWHGVGTATFPQAHAAQQLLRDPLLPRGVCQQHTLPTLQPPWSGVYTRAKLEVTLAMNIFMEESNQTPRTWCNILPKAGSSCVLRAAHSQLYPHEIFIERKLYNLSRQSGPSLTVLVGTCLSYQQSHLPEPQQVTCRMDNSIYWTVTERGLVCLANQNFGGFQFWPRGPGADFSLYKSCSQAVTQQNWVRWAGGSGFLLLPTVAVSSKSG